MKLSLLKTSITCSVLLLIFLSSCTTIQTTTDELQIRTQTVAYSSPHPILTSTLERTSTPTQLPIPGYMSAYIEGGYEQMNNDQFMCFVIDENKVHVAPLGGIVYKDRKIFIWVEVDYITDGILKHGNVLVHMQRGGSDLQNEFNKFTFSNSGQSGSNGTEAFYQSISKAWTDSTEGDHPIACGVLGLEKPADEVLLGAKVHDAFIKQNLEETGVVLLFDGVFPVVDGKPQSVTIYKIGDVLPITQAFIIQ